VSYSVDDFFRAARAQEGEIESALGDLDALRSRHENRRRELEAQVKQALQQLVVALLPELTAEACDRAGRLTGHGALLVGANPIGAMEAERARLTARLAELEADPLYRDRELLRAPRVGTLTRELDELEDFRAPLAEITTRAEHPRLERLLTSGYGTDDYAVPWWRLSYYRDWEAGDQLLERFPDKKTFAELRAELINARDTVAVYDRRISELNFEIAAGQAVEKERNETARALETLETRTLAGWRNSLADYLRATELTAFHNRLTGSPDLELLLKTWSGLAHKLDYLDRLADSQLMPLENTLRDELGKLRSDMVKYSRPKKAWTQFDPDKFQRRFGPERAARWRKRRTRYDTTYDTVWAFDRYDRASFVEDFLWWDLMTDGRLDGDFIPEVVHFRQSHPSYTYQRDTSDDDARAAFAAAEADRESRGATGGAFDAS
jgi:hypothetical protein